MISLRHRASLIPPWLRVILVLFFVATGSIAHTSAGPTGAPNMVGDAITVPSGSHCLGHGCERQAYHAPECCSAGNCACLIEISLGILFAEAGRTEHFRLEARWRRQLQEGIDRPPKQAKAFNLLPPQQDTV